MPTFLSLVRETGAEATPAASTPQTSHYRSGGLTVTTVRNGDLIALLHLSGELDLGSAALVPRLVGRLAATGYRVVQLDLSLVTFCDVAGLCALVGANNELRRVRGCSVITGLSGSLIRILALTGLSDALLFGNAESRATGPGS